MDCIMKVGGYIIDDAGNRIQLPAYASPSAEEVLSTLALVEGRSAVVGIKIIPEPDFGPYDLVVEMQNGTYLILLQEYSADGESDVRMLFNESAGSGQVDILGYMYGKRSVTNDFETVKAVFLEFLRTGDVARSLLS